MTGISGSWICRSLNNSPSTTNSPEEARGLIGPVGARKRGCRDRRAATWSLGGSAGADRVAGGIR